MKTKISIILLSILFHFGYTQQLVIDNQGHSGLIHDLAFADGGRQLISVSEDKTVRVWEVSSGTLKKTYRFEQETGVNGKIYASALSKDERFLFLGGFFGNVGDDGQIVGQIRILDLENERLLETLGGHDNIIQDLVISPDGKRLFSVSADKTIRIWGISGMEQGLSPNLIGVINGINYQISTLDIHPSGDIIAAGDARGNVLTWNISDLNKVTPSKSMMHTGAVTQVKFSQEGSILYSGGADGQLVKWTQSGRLLGIMDNLPGRINALEISADGEQLIVMGRIGVVYDIASESKISKFDYHTNAVSAIAAAPFGNFGGEAGSYIASAGGDDKNILIWEAKSGKLFRNLVGQGKSVFGVGVNEATGNIAFGQNNPNGNLDKIKLEKSFDLTELLLGQEVANANDFHRQTKAKGSLLITKASANSISFGDNIIYTDEAKDGAIRCYSFVNEGEAVIIGSTFSLNKYRTNGEKLGSFKGHLGEVWAVADYQKEDLLITGSSDQSIKIWNNITGENLLTLFVTTDNEWVIWTPQGFYEASAGGEKYIGWHINKGRNKLAEYNDVSAFRDYYHRRDVIGKMLALKSFEKVSEALDVTAKPKEKIIPPTVEWITPLSKVSRVRGGSTIVKFLITSQSPVTQIKLLADGRPIVTESNLSISGEGKAEEVEVTLTVPDGSSNTYVFSLFAMDKDSKVTSSERTISFLNEANNSSTTPSTAEPVNNAVSSNSGDSRNRLKLDPVEEQSQTPSNLYMVSIGVSTFENPKYNLNFAEADANSMAETFQKQQGKMFDNVKTIKLVNEKASIENILNTFQKLEKYTTVDDLVIIFIASHGMNVDGQFYIVPYDGKAENPRYSCIDWRDFSDLVGNMAAKVVLFIDTCHSGQLGSNIGQKSQNTTEAVRLLSGKEYGVVIMAAATGYEYSLEHSDWGHGAFTLAILEGINDGKADVKQDGTIQLRELDYYLADRVRELTGGRQHPTTQKPSSISRLSLAKTR